MGNKDNETLPPWVETCGNGNEDYWISKAMPVLPIHDYDGQDEFRGLVLTALAAKGHGGKKYVEMRLENRPFILKCDGKAEMCELGETLAYGSIPMAEFLERTRAPEGRSVMSRTFTFYEDGIDVITISAAGGVFQRPHMVVNVCRGYDNPKTACAGQGYANMSFLFEDDCCSFRRWLDRQAEAHGGESGEDARYRELALKHAEKYGIIEYRVNGNLMEYWSFFGSEGWIFVRYDLDLGVEVFRGANIPWSDSLSNPVPAFLKAQKGGLLYNYFQG